MEQIEWATIVGEEMQITARMARNEDLELSGVILFGTEDPRDGTEHERFRLMLLTKFYGNTDEEVEACKESFAQCVRIASVACNAYASIFFSECWIAVQDVREPLVPAGKRSDRTEALMMIDHHRDFGSKMHMASILREDGERSLAPWVTHGPGYQGRFMDLIPPCEMEMPHRLIARAIAERFGILDMSFDPRKVH
jgi:hypothetical protein